MDAAEHIRTARKVRSYVWHCSNEVGTVWASSSEEAREKVEKDRALRGVVVHEPKYPIERDA